MLVYKPQLNNLRWRAGNVGKAPGHLAEPYVGRGLADTRKIAPVLATIGVPRGASIAIIGDNLRELYWAVCAAQMIGLVPVLHFQEARAGEIGVIIGPAEIDTILAEDRERVDKLLALPAFGERPRPIFFM